MTPKFLATLILIAVSSGSLLAQESHHKEAAAKLVAIISPREAFLSAFTATVEPMLKSFPENKQADIRAAFTRFGEKVANSPELQERLTEIYMSTYSESELTELLAFYSTPIGKKSIKEMPSLMQKGAIVGQDVANQYQAGFQDEIKAILEKKE